MKDNSYIIVINGRPTLKEFPTAPALEIKRHFKCKNSFRSDHQPFHLKHFLWNSIQVLLATVFLHTGEAVCMAYSPDMCPPTKEKSPYA